MNLKFLIAAGIVALTVLAYLTQSAIGPRGQAIVGLVVFLMVGLFFSRNLSRVNWRVIGMGLLMQFALAGMILGIPAIYAGIEKVGHGVRQLVDFSNEGASFVFGPLAKPPGPSPARDTSGIVGGGGVDYLMADRFPGRPFYFFFSALPAVIFVSAFFTILYYYGVLQLVVRGFAWLMRVLMGRRGVSGAETLSVTANVFMGQTEAPLIVKPYIPRMTRSELITLMISGMAHISGGLIAVYIGMGADPVAILATCVMASPTGLYLAKMLLPETERPVTGASGPGDGEPGETPTVPAEEGGEKKYANAIEAAATGASEGMQLVLNIAAMLIAFIALVAMANFLLAKIDPTLSLQWFFAKLFHPAAMLMGVGEADTSKVAELLGTKLVLNEFVAYGYLIEQKPLLDPRSFTLATFALTGFANFASIGIQLGGIGPMTERIVDGRVVSRRGELAEMGKLALLGGFLATLINASIAGILI